MVMLRRHVRWDATQVDFSPRRAAWAAWAPYPFPTLTCVGVTCVPVLAPSFSLPSRAKAKRDAHARECAAMNLLEEKKKQAEAWLAKQPPSVEVAVATAGGAAQGGLIGALMATFSAMEPLPGAAGAMAAPKVRAPYVSSRHRLVTPTDALAALPASGNGGRAGRSGPQLRGYDGRQRRAAERHQESARRCRGCAGQVRCSDDNAFVC